MTLLAIGFEIGELSQASRCAPVDLLPDARLLVPARINGSEADLLLDSGATDGFTLDGAYVRRKKFGTTSGGNRPFTALPVSDHGKALVSQFSSPLFNFQAPAGAYMPVPFATSGPLTGLDATVHRHPFVGLIGAEALMSAQIVAVDSRRAEIAVSKRKEVVALLTAAVSKGRAWEVPLLNVPNSWVPITNASNTPPLPGGELGTWLLDTGARWSLLSGDYVAPAHARPRLLPQHLRLSDSLTDELAWDLEWKGRRTETLLPGPSLAEYAEDVGVERVDGVLGMDLLSQWVMVFDIAQYRVFFFDHD